MTEDIIKALTSGESAWYRPKGASEWILATSETTMFMVLRKDVEWRLHRPVDDLPWQVQAALDTQAHSKVYKKGWLDCCMALKPELKPQCEAARKELE